MILLDILYPRRCALCDRVVRSEEFPLCKRCRPETKLIKEPRCFICGKGLTAEADEYCTDCTGKTHIYEQGISALANSGAVKASMMRFKFSGRQEYAVFFARCMALVLKNRLETWKPEIMIPVPLHTSKKAKRGYNQAELLCSELEGLIGVATDRNLVRRTRKTKPQKDLDDRERKANLEQAFEITGKCSYNRVLIVDDIYTTGSTIDAVASVLKAAGVKNVYYAAACIGSGF